MAVLLILAGGPPAVVCRPAPPVVRPDVMAQATPCRSGVDSFVSVPDPSAPGGRRGVWIHRPQGPDRATIPVVYLLHGYPADPAQLAGGLAPQIDQLICMTGLPFVLAVPDGRSGGLDTEWGDDAAGRFDIESFVSDTAINLVEGAMRRPAALRAIGGFSMGGYGAAALALRHPDAYRQVAAFGGYYHVDDPDLVFGEEPAEHAPDQLVDAASAQRYFLVEGTDENTPLLQGSIRGEADRFAAILHGHATAVSVIHPPGGHDTKTWYSTLPNMVDFLDAGWQAS